MSDEGYLEGHILIAMPGMGDPRFERSVIYLCAHSEQGAMGFVVNKTVENMDFSDLAEFLKLDEDSIICSPPVHFGGPVETERGFVLHSTDFHSDDTTLRVSDQVSLTATMDILNAIAKGKGPQKCVLALGYAGWGPGQLESEIQANGWLHCSEDEKLLFGDDNDAKWDYAFTKLGIDAGSLSPDAGRA